jgi:adenylate kinase
MVILLFGAPGSGKGTQSKLLAAWLGVPSLSTGEMLRAEVGAGTDLGNRVAWILATGNLVGDAIVNHIVEQRIARPDCARGCILDGYPRTVAQARFLDELAVRHGLRPVALHLAVSTQALVTRITARRQCPRCKRIYNIILQPPRVAGRCDDDGTVLVTRDDDREDVLRARLEAYDSATAPVLAHYETGCLISIDGNRDPEAVFEDVRARLEGKSLRGTA